MPIQIFFAWRIYRLTKQTVISVLISVLSLVSFCACLEPFSCVDLDSSSPGGGVWTTVKIVIIKSFSRKPELHTSALVWFLAACVADVLITVTLVANLVSITGATDLVIPSNFTSTHHRIDYHSQSRRKTGFSATDDAISKIIRSRSLTR
jgi:hypothetical protein